MASVLKMATARPNEREGYGGRLCRYLLCVCAGKIYLVALSHCPHPASIAEPALKRPVIMADMLSRYSARLKRFLGREIALALRKVRCR
jgi:hypothetical protein